MTLFLSNIHPPFISAESHSIAVFAHLVSLGSYNAFKLVDGHTVSTKYKNHPIRVGDQSELYSFPYHSAGPFGEDIAGDWMSADDLFQLLSLVKLGWKDIHATNQALPKRFINPERTAVDKLKPFIPGPLRRMAKEILVRILLGRSESRS
jgi:hypothetical protein